MQKDAFHNPFCRLSPVVSFSLPKYLLMQLHADLFSIGKC